MMPRCMIGRALRAGAMLALAGICAACERGASEAPAAAVVAPPPAPTEQVAEDPVPEADGLRLDARQVFGLPAPVGLATIEENDAFARFSLTAPLGDVRRFYREQLEGFREEHYGSAGTGFVGTAPDGREVMLIRRAGQRALEVTYFSAGRDAAAIENRPDLADTRVRSLEAAQAAEAVNGGAAATDGAVAADPDAPTVRRIRPSEQPPLPAAWGAQPTRPSDLSANAAARSSAPSGATRGATIGAGDGAGALGAAAGSNASRGAAGRSAPQGADARTAPTGARGGVSGPRRVRDSPLDFGNPNFERPNNPNALH